MNQIQYIFKNLSWLFISQVLATICGFIWTIVTARYLGVSNYGILGFAMSITGIISLGMDMGISTHIIRHIATDYDSAPRYLGNAFPLKILLSIGTVFLTLVILIIMGCDRVTILVCMLFTLERVFMTMLGLINGTFQAMENGKYQAIEGILVNLLLLISIFAAIYLDLGIFGISMAYVIANALTLVYCYYILRYKIITPKWELDFGFCRNLIIWSVPFALASVFFTFYYSIDMVMITQMVGDYANGIYNASYKLVSVLTFLFSVYNTVIFPVMNKFFKREKNMLIVIFEKSVKYLMMIMIPLAFATVLYASDVVHLIYGTKYATADSCLSILVWTVCLIVINSVSTNLLNASHKEKLVVVIYMLAAIFNVSINFVLIPNYSYIGASIATVLSDLLILILSLAVMYNIGSLPGKRLIFDLTKIIIGSVILYGVLSILNISMWVAIPVAIVLYLGLIYVFRLVDDDDKFVIKEVLGR